MACLNAQQNTINARLKLLQYKWIMRAYITPVKLNKIYPNIPDKCLRGKRNTLCLGMLKSTIIWGECDGGHFPDGG